MGCGSDSASEGNTTGSTSEINKPIPTIDPSTITPVLNGNSISYRYDSTGRLAQSVNTGNGVEVSYEYDVSGNLVRAVKQ